MEFLRELLQNCGGLFCCKLITFLFQFCCSLVVLIEESGHLLIFKPLVADEFEGVAAGIVLQISIGCVDKTSGQIVLFLEEIVCQSSIVGALGNVFG